MEIFIEVNRLKGFQAHVLIVSMVFWEILIGFKLLLPLGIIGGVMNTEWLPSGHRETRFGQSSVASQAHHKEYTATGQEEPAAH